MKIKEIKELKTKDIKDLEKMVSKLRMELMKNTVKIAGGKEKNLKIAWRIKKEIAQILSIMKQKGNE
jgi:ribosomal protein L29